MCGIVGLYSISDEKVLNIKLNEAMKSLHHRGPDVIKVKSNLKSIIIYLN